MIEAAAVVSALIGHWDDFAIISALLLFNAAHLINHASIYPLYKRVMIPQSNWIGMSQVPPRPKVRWNYCGRLTTINR